jgi:hypothetical protein
VARAIKSRLNINNNMGEGVPVYMAATKSGAIRKIIRVFLNIAYISL